MKVVVLEGINAAGKSSVGALLDGALRRAGSSCLRVDPAGFGPLGKSLRELIVRPEFAGNPELDAILFTALRAEGAKKLLDETKQHPPAIVLLERWALALSAYGAVDGARPELVRELRSVLARTLHIDLSIILDVRGEIAFDRITGVGGHNRFELRGAEYLERVASSYRMLAEQEEDTVIVDASGTPQTTFENVRLRMTAKWSDLLWG